MNGYPDWIIDRGFGGADVAVAPGLVHEQGKWPNGPSAPGSLEAVEKLAACCRKDGDGKRCMVFLVGGAGNGKSFLASRVVQAAGATKTDRPTTFARRSYLYKTASGQPLRIINDATIPTEDRSVGGLLREISSALDSSEHLLACVNRGVLIGETNAVSIDEASGADAIAGELLLRTFQANAGEHVEKDGWVLVPSLGAQTGNLSFEVTTPAGNRFELLAVYMDSFSLLEPLSGDGDEGGFPNRISPIVDRREREARHAAFEQPLSKLATNIAREIGVGPPGGELDPVLANVRHLQEPSLVDTWCRILRGAELIEGSNFSYRDLWGLSVLSVVGATSGRTLGELAAWVRERANEVQGAKDELERCRSLVSLASLRLHLTMFGGLHASLPLDAKRWTGSTPENDAVSAMMRADPLLDVDPGLSRKLFELVSHVKEGRPLKGKLGSFDANLVAAWSPLEDALDLAIAALIDPMSRRQFDFDRAELLAWYAQYLVRLACVSTGRPAFSQVISEWQKLRLRLNTGKHIKDDILKAVRDVALPSTDDHHAFASSSLLPVLKPRVNSPGFSQPHLAMRVRPKDFEVEVLPNGEKMVVRIMERGSNDYAETAFDFHLLREALSRQRGNGFTDSLRHVEPRLERMRARLLSMKLHDPKGSGDAVFITSDGRRLTA
ncbi:hypothetical protein N8I71_17820 [Roseibacterium sp. SDUM158016]|uniref:hypothetical protein n=1 Tax=Roseicyclus sediminis TaxID=2980997 RepID=UPI0021CDF108|nr:hypothetical protein [Roseibacterium sp. SDUM158016]MCU4654701.1 hypothetical protein [Roseibacterium sp. SDUM158016]